MNSTVLFLCTGNYYRSRFAEILFNWTANQRGLAWWATSRGLALDPRNPGFLSSYTRQAMGRLRIPVEGYERFPAPVTADDFRMARHVIAVKEAEHRPLIARSFPEMLDRVEFWHVHDIDVATPEEAIPGLQNQVLALLDRLSATDPIPLPAAT